MRDYVQDRAMNNNPQDWNTLHHTVRHMDALRKNMQDLQRTTDNMHHVANTAVENVQGMTDEYMEHSAASLEEMRNCITEAQGHVNTTSGHVDKTQEHVTEIENLIENMPDLPDLSVLMETNTTASRYYNLMVRLRDAIVDGNDNAYDRITVEEINAILAQGVPYEAVLLLGWEMAAYFTAVFGGEAVLQRRFGNFAIKEMSPEIQEHLAYCMTIWNSNLFADVEDSKERLKKIENKIANLRGGRPLFIGRVLEHFISEGLTRKA